MFAAAMTSDDELRSILIARLNSRANLNNTSGVGAFPLLYNSNNGSAVEGQTLGGGIANPAQGALFALLALKVPVNSINISSSTGPASPGTGVPTTTSRSKKGSSVGTIIGSVIGGIVAVSVTGAFLLLRIQRRRDEEEEVVGPSHMSYTITGTEMMVTPFVATDHETTQEVGALRGMARQYTQSTHSEAAQTVPDDGRVLPSPSSRRLSCPMGAASGHVKGPSLRRADTFPSEGAHSHAVSNEPQREPAASPTATSEPLEGVASVPVPVEAQELRLAVESLQREMEQLRAERPEAPPSYTADPREQG